MNSGHANQAALRLILWSVVALAGLFLAAWVGSVLGALILSFHKIFIALWAAFLVATVYLFRDPDPIDPGDPNAIVSPAHGKVDAIESVLDDEFVTGAGRRISIRVSLLDVQVQSAPVAATLARLEHRLPLKEGDAAQTETLLAGFDVVGRPDTKVAVRLVAGTWGRRIVPWVRAGDVLARGTRIAMMRPGSRVELVLPAAVKLQVNLGDTVVGGQTVVGKFE